MWFVFFLCGQLGLGEKAYAEAKALDIKGVSRDLPFKLGPKDEKERIRFIEIRTSYYQEVLETIF